MLQTSLSFGFYFSDTINEKLKEFLIARNPKHQHSATLDSYLIKPIQRILKYPLLLQQLCNLTDSDTDEHHHLSGNNRCFIYHGFLSIGTRRRHGVLSIGPRRDKTCLWGFRQSEIQTSPLSYRD